MKLEKKVGLKKKVPENREIGLEPMGLVRGPLETRNTSQSLDEKSSAKRAGNRKLSVNLRPAVRKVIFPLQRHYP